MVPSYGTFHSADRLMSIAFRFTIVPPPDEIRRKADFLAIREKCQLFLRLCVQSLRDSRQFVSMVGDPDVPHRFFLRGQRGCS